jgi:tungstate transport system permease protein
MGTITQGFIRAVLLIFSGDPELFQIIFLSLQVSGTALLLATLIGLPAGALCALKRLPLRGLLINLMNTFMGLPPVVVGLLLYLFLSRSGPLGFLSLLYSPSAMIIAQTVLATPIVFSLFLAAIVAVDPVIRQAARTLGATQFQEALTLIREARYGITAGIIAGFGRVSAGGRGPYGGRQHRPLHLGHDHHHRPGNGQGGVRPGHGFGDYSFNPFPADELWVSDDAKAGASGGAVQPMGLTLELAHISKA